MEENNISYTQKVQNAISKFQSISSELKSIFVERDEVIDNSIKALITGQSVLLIGPPGTAKSALTDELCKRIVNGRYFSWLLNRTSDPSEILGPFSIREMEQDKFVRVTKNKLPEAEIVFLDEIFKCNEPTLNILLPLINEKLFYNDGKPVDVPLISLFAASNEFPEEDSLLALYDRMIFRMYVDYVGDVQNKMIMLKNFLSKGSKNDSPTTVTIDDINVLREAMDNIEIDDSILKEYIALMNALLREGIVVSDRRQNECLKVLRVSALLDNRESVNSSDFKCLRDVLWNEPSEIEKIEEVLKESSVSAYEKEYNTIKKRYVEIVDASETITDVRMIVEIKSSVEYLYEKLKRIMKEKELMEDGVLKKFESLKKEVEDYLEYISKQVDEDDLMM
ncbi:AAA family ATPase [Clostridium cylindrosporum]|uniref:ATPase, AAA family n=1 Tax=Clostridium cylindrosporum DSM 605 TaxID=1121307 RepID=A0A0J8DG76_CLOCY|nr:AAA family ATPase [Clostridium cylindrosporum]KMT23173.1 ATPase, AAA family [Clostridium cylindrosporum DSM 605]